MTADEVKAALRRRHPAAPDSMGPGAWTCIAEFHNIDLLAVCAWRRYSGFKGTSPVVGYEVKVSRSDYRAELLNPSKRAGAVAHCTQFYFAVPEGLLTPLELEWPEPEWDYRDFARERCPAGCRKLSARQRRNLTRYGYAVPTGAVVVDRAELVEVARGVSRTTDVWVTCSACEGKGYASPSRVELEAPTLWIPRDVGLVSVGKRGCTVQREAPHREPQTFTRHAFAQMVRWASYRPDPRHARASAGLLPLPEEDSCAAAMTL